MPGFILQNFQSKTYSTDLILFQPAEIDNEFKIF